ncbi:MAG: glycosyltransferase [Desulfomonile tiedjei]|nr:glycosyltransferase [Desulfomonile tiedjei]
MRITACVATKNRTDMLHQLLWSLIRQEYKDWDLVIVDDSDVPVNWNSIGVYPRLFSEITRTGHDIRIAAGPRVSRIGAAYQVGLKVAKTENPLFFRVDDDSWLEADYFSRLVQVMKQDDVGACGGLFLHPGQEIETLEPHDPRYSHATIEGLSDQVNIQWCRHKASDLVPVEHLTANILFSRKWLERIGGFETLLYNQHRDETQATWRLHVEGARLFVHPLAIAWHLRASGGGSRGYSPDVYLNDHRKFMAQRKSMKPGIHLNLGHAIGDGFMATPMIHMMREMNPNRNLAVFAPWAKAILDGNPDLDEIADHPLDAQRTVRLEQSVYAWASANGWKGHLAQAYCRMFDLPEPKDLTPRFFWNSDKGSFAQTIPEGPYIVIAPWSTAKTFDYYGPSGNKNWPLDRWPEVVAWAHEKGFRVVQLRGSKEEPLIDGVDVDLCERPLREAFAVVEKASLMVSVDTMAHHAAAAFGVPGVVLWGRSKASHFGYTKENIINIQGECPGIAVQNHASGVAIARTHGRAPMDGNSLILERPCINDDQWAMDKEACPIPGHPCMAGISTDTVIAALERLWGGPF